MRDHLLGCQAFLPPEPDPQDLTVHLRRRFPLGAPVREEVESFLRFQNAVAAKQEITAFEDFDHTPEHMRNDFPREYDLQTMLNEAAGRGVLALQDFAETLAAFDAEMQRLCVIEKLYLPRDRNTSW